MTPIQYRTHAIKSTKQNTVANSSHTETAFTEHENTETGHKETGHKETASKEFGFSLIEVLMALLLFSLAATALIQSHSASAKQIYGLRHQHNATIIAENLLVLQLAQSAPPHHGRFSGEDESYGYKYLWRRDITPTAFGGSQKITISVYDANSQQLLAQRSAMRGAPQRD